MKKSPLLPLTALLLAGCATAPPLPDPPPAHPASADAQEAPVPERSATLATRRAPASRPAPAPASRPAMPGGHMGGRK
jgi:hypothetical protein